MEPLAFFRFSAATFGFIAILFGLTAQVWRNYHKGESTMHWLLNAAMMGASFSRGAFFFFSGEYLLMSLDVYGFAMSTVLTLQGVGFFVKQKKRT